jgi:UDP-N-acetylmuramoyl-tripeptide--D-alanyl-D-alanine ligase
MGDFEHASVSELLGRMEKVEFKGISIDSRNIREGELFVALRGDRFDGHDFVPEAIERGAWGALVDRSALEDNYSTLGALKNIFPVEDTLFALQEMAQQHRRKFSIHVVGVTGSNGKTTTKEMIGAVLKQNGPVLKTEGNLNNHIGVPLTLLKLNAGHRAAVVELGASAPGEIDMLARMAVPTVGVITNIGPAHLEFFGSLDKTALAKGELLRHLAADAKAVLNADDRFFSALKGVFSGRTISFGIENPADVSASGIRQAGDCTDFTITAEGSRVDVRLRAVGAHNVYNALAAAAAAVAVGEPLDAVKYGLESFSPVEGRSELRELKGRTVLTDYYNANPASMEAALRTLVSLGPRRKAVAVLGDMLELGAAGAEAHREIGRLAARLKVDALIVIGALARCAGEGAVEAGLPKARVAVASSHADAARLLREASQPGDAVLVKGSRGSKMEKIIEEF